jgi:hypothetical protein
MNDPEMVLVCNGLWDQVRVFLSCLTQMLPTLRNRPVQYGHREIAQFIDFKSESPVEESLPRRFSSEPAPFRPLFLLPAFAVLNHRQNASEMTIEKFPQFIETKVH